LWSFNVIGAITTDRVVGFWVMEGTMNHQVFTYFLQTVVSALLQSEAAKGRRIVLHIDNARPHENDGTAEAITKLGVSVVFNARYSPMLNSIEMLWNECKRRLMKHPPVGEKQAFVEQLVAVARDIDRQGKVPGLWKYAVSNWQQRLEAGK
jgi:transposase